MTEGKPYFRTPALAPDGRTLAFVYANDIWLVDAAGGHAERLTAHYATHISPRFSPDGSLLAFTSTRSGGGDVYTLSLAAGSSEVRRLTYSGSFCDVEDWSADGQHVLYSSDQEQQGFDIYRVALAGGTPHPLLAEPYEQLAHAAVAPDGAALAFNVVHGRWWQRGPHRFAPCDIWLGAATPQPAEARELPRKLTGGESVDGYIGLNRWPLWDPDGAGLYFVSDRADGIENLWYMELASGATRQVTHFREGRVLWPAIARNAGLIVFERDAQLWRLDPREGEAAPLSIQARTDSRYAPSFVEQRTRGFSELALAPDGKKLVFVAHGEIFADFADKETDKERRQGPSFRITDTHARESQVRWTPDSRSLIYVSDRHGEPELYRYDFAARAETRLTDDAVPKFNPCCSPDGVWVAYIRGTDAICLLNLQTGETRPFAQGSFVWNDALAWSPDSRWLAFISHDERFFGNVYLQHITDSSAHQITFLSNITGDNLLWAPDGRFLIFTSGHYRREAQIVRVDLRPPAPHFRETEFERLFAEKEKDGDKEQAQAPVAEAAPAEEPEDTGEDTPAEEPEDTGEDTPAEEPEDTGEDTPADEPEDTGEDAPAAEAEAPADAATAAAAADKPDEQTIELMLDGIERRLRFLTPLQMDAQAQAISRNGRDLLFLAAVAGKTNIWTLPLDEPRRDYPPGQLTASSSSKRQVQFSPGGKSFYYLDDGQITIRKFPQGSEPTVVHVRSEVTVDFHQEKQHVFYEAWRLLRDTFYDPTFRGQDWPALREQFAPLVAGAQTPGELMLVLNLMIGELGASHTGAYWYSGSAGSHGYTGLLFAPEELAASGLLRVASVVPDSPAALLPEPPRVGEYLLAVDDTPLEPPASLDELLQRSVGRRLRLRLAATPEGENTRDLAVRPIDGDDYSYLRYRAWAMANKQYVHRISEGRLGYVHIDEMSYEAYQQFLIDLDTETHSKAGVILDIRYNGGGHISTFILDVLARRNVLRSGFRDRLATDPYHISGNRALHRPTVLVTNESSVSDAEIFTELYRRLGLGRVVGKPTAGRVIGTVSRGLLNGSYLRLPIYSYHTPEGEDLEGTGRTVDIEATRPLGEWSQDRDRQLEAAVRALLELIDGTHEHA
jgi:Tol biopolymer transport system component/C-terminal processing protease CtpA/Prc